MVSAQLLEKDRAEIPKKVLFCCWYRGILLYNVRIVQWCTFKAGARQGKGKGVKDLGRIYGGVAHLQPKCFHCTAHQHSTGPHDFTFALHRTTWPHYTAQDHMTTLHSIGPHDHTPLQSTRPHHMTTQNSTAPHDFTFGLHSKQCTVILDFAMHKKCNAINVDKEKYKS